jgi:hypothetical protein
MEILFQPACNVEVQDLDFGFDHGVSIGKHLSQHILTGG